MKVARRLIELAINAKTLYESHSAEERIELLKNICSNRVLDGRRAEYHLRSSLAVLVDMKKNQNWRIHHIFSYFKDLDFAVTMP
jgi:hypothetical protein